METAYQANASQKPTVLLGNTYFKVKSIKMLHDQWCHSVRYNNYDLTCIIIWSKNRQDYKETWIILTPSGGC